MILAYGITGGYYYPDKEKPRSKVNKQAFLEKAEAVAADLNISFREYNQVWGNFYAGEFVYEDHSVFALLNAYHPVVSFAKHDTFGQLGSGFPIEFIDVDELASAFCQDYLVLTISDLEQPFDLEKQPQLRNVESVREQVAYYKPKTIGDVVFNCWD